MSKIDRLDLYLQNNIKHVYENSKFETELVTKFHTLFTLAKEAQEKKFEGNPENLEKYRKDSYNKLIKEVNQLTTQEEKDKLNQEDNQTISPQEEANFNKR